MEEAKVVVEKKEEGLDLGEVPTDEGHREELVELTDVKLVMEMSKDKLQEYAITRLSTDLNLSDRLKLIRVKVVHLIREQLKKGKDPKPVEKTVEGPKKASNQPEYIFNPKNRRIFEYTEALGQKIDYIPCFGVDLNGKRL